MALASYLCTYDLTYISQSLWYAAWLFEGPSVVAHFLPMLVSLCGYYATDTSLRCVLQKKGTSHPYDGHS
jgi:hypothetical protein